MRRPRLDYESHAVALDCNELGALLVAAGFGPSGEHALISLLALDGLRVSEATGADIEGAGDRARAPHLGDHPQGAAKVVTIPLASRTARAIDLAIGERTEGPIFLATDGRRLDRHGAGRIVRRIARRAGITKAVGPHTLRHAFITAALDAKGPATRCAGSGLARRPTGHDEIRPGPYLIGPPRHLYRGRLRRRGRPVGRRPSWHASAWTSPGQADRH